MNYDKYENISISTDALAYNFVSSGTKGDLQKLVEYRPFNNNPDVYNLSLSTIDEEGNKDFDTQSKNGDANKVLATIGTTAYVFIANNPNKMIYLEGNTPAKTRFYKMAITKAHDELCDTFLIYGVNKIDNKLIPVPFVKNTVYDAYLFKRREEEENIQED